ncbi:MAG: carboxypeptidase regulatory-like domain-containing protein [Acidobacteriaceae bacterium]
MKRSTLVLSVILSIASVFFVRPSVWAQQTMGAINGDVKDPSGAVVPDTSVTLLSEKNGFVRKTKTSSSGEYQFLDLPVGTYLLTFTHVGFDAAQYPAIRVRENRTTTLYAALKTGSVKQSVTVHENPMLNAVDTTNGYDMDQAQIKAVPLATGSFTQLAVLSPGVSSQFIAGTGVNAGLGNQPIWANGQRDTSNTFQLNGVDITNLFNGKTTSQSVSQRLNFNIGEGSTVGGATNTATSVYGSSGQGLASPPPEFIQELRVNASMYDAQQGTTSGAQIDVNTMTGTNELHGQAWLYRGTNWLNAAPFFYKVPYNNIPKNEQNPELHRITVGATAGGPIIKNKLFLFLGYQAQRVSDQSTGLSSLYVPPGLTNDRSANGLLTACNSYEQGTANPTCPIQPSQFDPAAIAILQAKLPNGQYLIPSAGANTVVGNPNVSLIQTTRFSADQVTGDMDYDATQNDRMSLKYYYQHDPSTSPFGVSNTEGFPQQEDSGAQVASLDNAMMVTPKFNWEQRFGLSRQKVYSVFQSQLNATDAGISLGNGYTAFPGISVGTFQNANSAGGIGFGPNNDFVNDGYFQNRFSPSTNAIFSLGRHNLSTGFSYAYTQLNIRNRRTGIANLKVNTFPDFLEGNIRSGSILVGNSDRYYRSKESGAYAQDQWQAFPNLSVNMGVRYDYNGPLYEANGNMFNFDPTLFKATETAVINDGLIVAGNNKKYATPGVSASTLKGRQWGIGPRIGFAWSPDKYKGRVVVRSGFGVYYDRGEYFQYLSPPAGQGVSGPFGVTQEPPLANYVNSDTGPGTLHAPFVGQNLNGGVTTPGQFVTLLPTAAQIKAGALDGNPVAPYPIGNYNIYNKLPYSMNYMLDIEWQPRNDLAMTLGYAGNRGRHLVIPLPFNQPLIPSQGNPVNGEQYAYGYQVLSPITGNPLSTEPYSTYSGGNVDLRVPFVGYDPNSTSFTAAGVSAYDALQAHLEKRLSHGMQFGSSYTYSHTLDEQSDIGLFFTGDNPNKLRDSYATADFDTTHTLSFTYLFELPTIKAGGRLLRVLTNGWQMVGVATFQSGQPYSIYDFTGAVASEYYGTNISLLNPIVPLAKGFNPKSALTGHSGAFLDNAGNPIPAINPAAIAVPLLSAGQNGVPPCDPSGGTNNGPLCDTAETGFAPPGERNIFREAFQKRADASFQKTTDLTSRYQLQYSLDVFNLTNTTSFDIPNDDTSIGTFAYNYTPTTGDPITDGFYTLPTMSNLNGFAQVQHTIGSARIVQMSLHFIY